jgi:NAD+ kinase
MFKTIGILARVEKDRVIENVVELTCFLVNKGYKVFIEDNVKEYCDNTTVLDNLCALDNLIKKVDIILVIGGDGSVLSAGRKAVDANIPIVGINRGELGFLADISPKKIEMEKEVQEILDGNFFLEERIMLKGVIRDKDNNVVHENTALNDIVLQAGQVAKMIEFELYIDGKFVSSQKADGLIVSTPTGSTAYSLSAGGSIITPSLDVLSIVPINPHTLSSRPIIVSANSKIRIKVSSIRSNYHPICNFDGQDLVEIDESDIYIEKHVNKVKLIHLSKYNYHKICRDKLGWS